MTTYLPTSPMLRAMKSLQQIITIVCVLVAPLSKAEEKPGPVGTDQNPSKDGKKLGPMDVRGLLEKGRTSGALPEGMVIRIGACLGAADKDASGKRVPDETKETWEFTANQVRRIATDEEKGNARAESRAFDSKGLCKDLLEGKAIEIQARKGEGPEVGFVGTSYHLGWRYIELVWKGKTILDLHESRAAGILLYRESDARAFAAIYERLASQARVLFQPKARKAD